MMTQASLVTYLQKRADGRRLMAASKPVVQGQGCLGPCYRTPAIRSALPRVTLHVSRFTALFLVLAFSLSLNLDLSFAASFGLGDRVLEKKLTNGLTILMVERHQTPVVSLNMTFAVGGVNEQVGQTGLAHLYEHMAFKGTRTVGTKDYEKERPILDEWYQVGTELERRQRELARRSQEKSASQEDQTTIEKL
ncbi:MAG TPA: insulinase family protein, partial [Nitrospiraceae bacterium]|nr:insulinase family protein [Nitrospiraceae bacterium]